MNARNQQELSRERRRNVRSQAAAAIQAFTFGPFRIVPYARLLERNGLPITLSSRAFDLLCLLISRPGEVISKSELMAGTWPNVSVEESSLRFHITQLRRALGDCREGERYVVNVPGRGYCFVAHVGRATAPSKQNSGDRPPRSILPVRTEWQLEQGSAADSQTCRGSVCIRDANTTTE